VAIVAYRDGVPVHTQFPTQVLVDRSQVRATTKAKPNILAMPTAASRQEQKDF